MENTPCLRMFNGLYLEEPLKAQVLSRAEDVMYVRNKLQSLLRSMVPIFLLVVSLILACEKSPTGPEPFKDPRTYTFTIDTLAYPDAFQTNMQDIAGTSANNVFAVGFNSMSSAGAMYRFDGRSWRTTGFHMTEGGPIFGAVDFYSLVAFSATNIWFVGARTWLNPNPPPNFIDSSFILHYNGRTWQEHKAYGARLLESIHGIAPNDIWAGGWYGTLLHYNGVQWERDSIPLSVRDGAFFAIRDIQAVSSQMVYALGQVSKLGEITMFYLFQRSAGRWAVIDSTLDGAYGFGTSDLWASPSGTLYSVGGIGVYRLDGRRWTRIFDSAQPLSRIWGYSDNSFFVGGYRTLLHYNGTDFFQYPHISNYDTINNGIWGDGREVFVIGIDGRKTLVFHGR